MADSPPQCLLEILRLKGSRLIVGSIVDAAVLQEAPEPAALAAQCDLIELRLDVLGAEPSVRTFAEECAGELPFLITARHPAEGGVGGLSAPQREALLRDLLDGADAIDVELRSLRELAALWSEAADRGLGRVASFHDFASTPPLAELQEHIEAAAEAGADVAKLAFRINGAEDLHTLIALMDAPAPLPLAVMGMGPLAPASRLLAAQLGSVLNYGYLGEAPAAPGQWPARLLKQALQASPER